MAAPGLFDPVLRNPAWFDPSLVAPAQYDADEVGATPVPPRAARAWLPRARPAPPALVFTPDPVNRHHPFNRGLRLWWLPVAPRDGGHYLYDLLGLYHGTLTAGTAPPAWVSAPLAVPAAVHFTGGTVRTASAAWWTAPPITLAAWFCPDAGNAFGGVIASTLQGGIITNSTGSTLVWVWNNDGTDYAAATGMTLAAGQWYWAGLALAAGTATLCLGTLDGTFKTFTQTATQVSANLSGSAFELGSVEDLHPFLGSVTDGRVWDRTLPAGELFAVFENALCGYPGVLNRRAPAAYLLPGVTLSHTPAVGGGLVVGGKAAASASYPLAARGGLVGGARAVPVAAFHPTSRGGLLGGGTAIATAAYVPAARGGLAGGGQTVLTAAYTITARGGLPGGGHAVTQTQFTAAPGGGFLGGSTTTAAAGYLITPRGGLAGGGTAIPAGAYVVTPQGGLAGGGHTVTQVQFSAAAEGGLLGGGSAGVAAAWHLTARGGLTGGGDGLPAAHYPLAARGGLLVGGYGVAVSGSLVTPRGGLAGGGTTLVRGPVYAPAAGGGIMVGARVPAVYALRLTAGGGVAAGGTTPAAVTYQCLVGGGLAPGGHALLTTHVPASGPYRPRGDLHADRPGSLTPTSRPRTRWQEYPRTPRHR